MKITKNKNILIQLPLLCLVTFTLISSQVSLADTYKDSYFKQDPYHYQVDQELKKLTDKNPEIRAAAIENLSFLRDCKSSDKIIPMLNDPAPVVRREAAMNLGWTGNRGSLKPLLKALNDPDWSVRQAAEISLENLTGQQITFNGLADKSVRKQQIENWKNAVNGLTNEKLLQQLNDLYQQPTSRKPDFFRKADLIRAIGAMHVLEAAPLIIDKLKPYLKKEIKDNISALYKPEGPAAASRPEKIYVQAMIRSLGKLGTKEGTTLLVNLLQTPQWASYAADALGDIGGEYAASVLIQNYKDYAFPVKKRFRHRNDYKKFIKKVPKSDAPRFSAVDRIPRVAHTILQSLCRIDFNSPENIKALQEIVPNILATMPSDFDSTMVYEHEPYQMMAGYLLEKAALRRAAVNAVFIALKIGNRKIDDSIKQKQLLLDVADDNINSTKSTDMPYAGTILMSCCREKQDIPLLIKLLSHKNGWIKIHAAKTLMFMNAQEAIPSLIKLLKDAKDDADYGYDMNFSRFVNNNVKEKKLPGSGYDEYSDPSPRFKEAYIMALGGLKAKESVPLLIKYLNNDRNVVEIQYAAAKALYQIATTEALEALKIAEAKHPFESIRQVAREAVWHYGLEKIETNSKPKIQLLKQLPIPSGDPAEIVFIKGPMDSGNHEQISSDQSGYSTTDGGPTYRLGKNIYKFKTTNPDKTLVQLTHFKDGFVADIEVSYDGKHIIFAHRGPISDPWWHIYEINADGTGLRQITHGPYHDVQPNYMPDGRIVFSTSRLGMRDEYHGYATTGLAVMNNDGTDIHMIGFNLGRDSEPVVGNDGKILFTRLELFYSRMKTEWNVLSVFPDGTNPVTLYGPERREFWKSIRGCEAISPPRHRTVRTTQPQPWSRSQYLINSFKGPMLTGPGHFKEKILRHDNKWAVTTPFKLSDKKLLVAAGKRPNTTHQKKNKKQITKLDLLAPVDLGIYYMNVDTGKLTLIYNDPKTADFEARPLQPSKIPRILPEAPFTRTRCFTGKVYCNSIYTTRQPHVKERGKYIRVIEGVPTVTRNQTHMNGGIAWRNHGGAIGRDLGTVPVASDGSFALELPSDRMFHFQVLDSDRNVVGNELIWQYTRPGEIKSCVGCHEMPDSTPEMTHVFPLAHKQAPLKCLPNSDDMLYRAKMWFKGWAPDEREERMHTVNSVNIIGRQ